MIPGIGLAVIGKYWKFAVVGVVGLALVIALLVARSDANHWRGKYKTLDAQHKTFVADVKVNAAAILVKALDRVKADYAARLKISTETSHDYQSQLASSYARYNRLLAQRGSGRPAGQTAAMPVVPDASCRFNEIPGSPGVLAIRADCALNILEAADQNTIQLENLQGWVSRQGSVTVPIE